jgi:hypothetical protein
MSIAVASLTGRPIGDQKRAIVPNRRPIPRILIAKPDVKLTAEPR